MLSNPVDVASPPNNPARTPPKEEARNHNPIICPKYLFGEYLEKADNPTGEIKLTLQRYGVNKLTVATGRLPGMKLKRTRLQRA